MNSDLHVYLAEIHRTAALTAEEEKELGWKIINDGCAASRSQMVQTNLRLVAAIAGNYAGRGHSLAELIDAGIVGLIRAVDGFDPAWGARFSTYASWWIKQAIKQSLLSNEQPVLA